MRNNSILFSLVFALLGSHLIVKPHDSSLSTKNFTQSIEQKAQEWVQKCISLMDDVKKQLLCNMLGLSCSIDAASNKNVQIAQECAKYLTKIQESDITIKQATEQLQRDIQALLNDYIVRLEQKLAQHASKNINQEDLAQHLEAKIPELIARITIIYYKAIYSHMHANNLDSHLTYMFKEDGVIPEDDRTEPLPEPSVVQEQFKKLVRSLKANS